MSYVETRKGESLFWILLYWVTFPLISAKLTIFLVPLVLLFLFVPAKSSNFYTGGNPTVKSRYLRK